MMLSIIILGISVIFLALVCLYVLNQIKYIYDTLIRLANASNIHAEITQRTLERTAKLENTFKETRDRDNN
jgi:hypothetical protein